MKKVLFIVAAMFLMTSCYTEDNLISLTNECHKLENSKYELTQQISNLRAEVTSLRQERNVLNSGREPRYIVKFTIKQGTFTLDIFEHIKNDMNAIEVEFPVTKDFYNRVKVGQDMTDAFKWGSLVFNGDFSTLHMRVTGKRVE